MKKYSAVKVTTVDEASKVAKIFKNTLNLMDSNERNERLLSIFIDGEITISEPIYMTIDWFNGTWFYGFHIERHNETTIINIDDLN
jgi:hypothetical protein